MSDTKNYLVGQTVNGTVTGVNGNAIYLEVEEGVKAVIYRQNFADDEKDIDITEMYCEGSDYSGQIKNIGTDRYNKDVVVLELSHRLEQDEAEKEARIKAAEERFAAIKNTKENDEIISAKVSKIVNGGAELTYNNFRLFLPAKQFGGTEDELKALKGKNIDVIITYIDENNRRAHVSKVAADKKLARLAKLDAYASIKVDDVLEGTVENIIESGAIVNLGAVSGLLHISQIDHSNVKDANQFLKVGQKVNVKVIKVDADKKRIGLSMKALKQHPWDALLEKYNVGDVFEGTIDKIIPAGLLIKLTDEYSGLMPKFEYSWQFGEKYDETVVEGGKITVKVKNIDSSKKKVSLSHRETVENVWGNLGVKKGDTIDVIVSRLVEKGAEVSYNGVIGWLPISEVTNLKRINSVAEVYPLGTTVTVAVKEFEPSRAKLVVSSKALMEPVVKEVKVAEEEKFVDTEPAPEAMTLGDYLNLNKKN